MISNYIKAKLRDYSSSLRYEDVTYTGGLYEVADVNTPFKGLVIGEEGTVVIRGVDEQDVTLTLPAGVYPLGGIAIVESGTSASSIVAAY